MSETLTVERALELLERAVVLKGAAYVYRPETLHVDGAGEIYRDGDCVYVEDGEPSCIVGHVIAYAGGNLADVEEGALPNSALSRAGVEFTDNAYYVLRAAQNRQDAGGTWGSSLACARRAALVSV